MAESSVGRGEGVAARPNRRRPNRLTRGQQAMHDVISGLVVSLVMVSYSLSFAVLIFSGPLAGYLALGVPVTLLSAGLCGIMVALGGSMRMSIAGPDTATMAVISALSAGIAVQFADGPADVMIAHVMAGITLTTVIAGVTLYGLGAARMGAWIRYIPYPVLGGFLASTGWLLSAGAVKIITGQALELAHLSALLDPAVLSKLIAGVGFVLAIVYARSRIRHDFALPGVLVAGIAVAHVALAASGLSPDAARAAGWLLPRFEVQTPWMPWFSDVWLHLEWQSLLPQVGEVAAATGITAIAILLNATGLEVWRKSEVELDRDLRAHGLANVVTGLLGGTIGNLTLNRTMLNQDAGGRTRLSGVAMGVICLAILFVGNDLIGLIPTPVLGGLLLFLGVNILNNWLVRSWKRISHADYMLILAILLLIVNRSYLEGLLLGVVASCIFFALNYSRVRVIKHSLTRQEYGSNVERSKEHTQLLQRFGNEIQILWLQGYLFFGSANRMLEEAKRSVDAPAEPPVRFVVLDFRLVAAIDSSALFSFIKLRNFAEDRGVHLVFCGMSPATELAFRAEGLFADNDPVISLRTNLDLALEWAEEAVLRRRRAQPVGEEPAFESWLSRELTGEAASRRFLVYVDAIELDAGGYLFRQGEAAESLFFVLSGRVSVILERDGAEAIRLRSMIGYTVVGEMGLYRDATRVASVVAEEKTRVYRLSRASLRRMEAAEPALASAFHAFIVRTVADRLNFANYEIAALQR